MNQVKRRFFDSMADLTDPQARSRWMLDLNLMLDDLVTACNNQFAGLPVYADNATALAGGLKAGQAYRTGADPDVVCTVH